MEGPSRANLLSAKFKTKVHLKLSKEERGNTNQLFWYWNSKLILKIPGPCPFWMLVHLQCPPTASIASLFVSFESDGANSLSVVAKVSGEKHIPKVNCCWFLAFSIVMRKAWSQDIAWKTTLPLLLFWITLNFICRWPQSPCLVRSGMWLMTEYHKKLRHLCRTACNITLFW